MLRGRRTVTVYEYDDHGRVARTFTRSPWTPEDRALMLAYQIYLDTLCPGICGQPKAKAWHSDNEGWYRTPDDAVNVCQACTAIQRYSTDTAKPVEFIGLVHDRDYDTDPLPAYGSAAQRRAAHGGRRP